MHFLCNTSELPKGVKFFWNLREDCVILGWNLLSTALTAGEMPKLRASPRPSKLLQRVQGFLLDLWKRGERMSLEAITKIRAVEDGVEQSKADAKAQAAKLIADAEREGRALLHAGREKAAAASAEAMKAADGKAAGRREEILAQSAKDCQKLKADASARMDKAVQAILGRVVET